MNLRIAALGATLLAASANTLAAGLAYSATPADQLPVLTLPSLDLSTLKREPRNKPLPLRFAIAQALSMRPAANEWETLADGRALWRKRVQSPNASSLSFAFGEYRMPAGGELYVYNLDHSDVRGPYTAEHNSSGQLWTALVRGREAIIEVSLPAAARDQLKLQLTQANAGFLEFWNASADATDKSGSCNIDVACADGDAWRDDIRAVARFTIAGQYLCTGQLVNNTALDFTPYFLTANHCISSTSDAPSTVFYWNYQSSSCNANDGRLDQNQSGASLVATYSTSDFTLLKLDQKPSALFRVYYAGWDHALDPPADGVVGIHHPGGDEKRISFSDHPTHATSYGGSGSSGDGTHLQIEKWDRGTTEGGSSGSGLWNKNHHLVGQLHGGNAACDAPDASDWYGRLAVSWEGGGASDNSLAAALDPNKSGVSALDGADPATSKSSTLDKGISELTHGRYGGALTPLALYALLMGAVLRRRRYSVVSRYLRSRPRNW